jgi:hypothetical protein
LSIRPQTYCFRSVYIRRMLFRFRG